MWRGAAGRAGSARHREPFEAIEREVLMMNAGGPFVLGDWTVDPATGTLTGAAGQRRLTPKLTDLLVALARRAGHVASRDELLREVWGERSAVSDEPLTRAIAELRKMLGDTRADPSYIATIPKRGYRMVSPVGPAPAARTPAPLLPASAALQPAIGKPAAMLTASVAVAPSGDLDTESSGGLPPRSRERWPQRTWRLVALGLAASGLAASVVALVPRAPTAAAPPAARPAAVAVLPFQDLSPASDRQYFADGIQEAIMGRLAGIPGLRVASRAAVDAYRDASLPPREVAGRIGVDVLVEGSVRYDERRVHVTAQLVDASTNARLWEQAFDRPLTVEHIFDIQTDIADRVTEGLARSLSASERRHAAALPTASLSAYEAFLLGKYHYRRRQPGDIQIAIEQFQLAVNADGGFADAWDWLAFAWVDAGVELGWTTPAQAFPHARAAALRALELDPGLATSQAVLGYLRAVYDWDWQPGLVELERAVAAAPRETGTVWGDAYVLSLLGRHDEAIALVSDLAAAFPADGRMKQEVAERLIDAGRYAEAIRAGNQALDAGAEPGQIHELLGIASVGASELETAISELENALLLQQRGPQAVGYLAATYALAGRRDEARLLLRELEARARTEQLNDVMLARIYLALGDRSRALTLLEGAAELRLPDLCGIRNDPFFVPLRGEARFAAVVARMGLGSTAPVG